MMNNTILEVVGSSGGGDACSERVNDEAVCRINSSNHFKLNAQLQNYQHSVEKEKLERSVKELEEFEDRISKANVRCHMLQVELLTRFSPYVVDSIRQADATCQSCKETITDLNGVENSGNEME